MINGFWWRVWVLVTLVVILLVSIGLFLGKYGG